MCERYLLSKSVILQEGFLYDSVVGQKLYGIRTNRLPVDSISLATLGSKGPSVFQQSNLIGWVSMNFMVVLGQ